MFLPDAPLSDTFQLKLPCKNYLYKNATASTALSSTETINGDVDTDLIEVVNIFGMRFFSIVVQHLETCTTCYPPPPQPPPNAFNILMESAKATLGKDLPKAVVDPKNNMERLRNRVLLHFEEGGCKFPRNAGKELVHLFRGCATCCITLMASLAKSRRSHQAKSPFILFLSKSSRVLIVHNNRNTRREHLTIFQRTSWKA